MEKLSVKYSQGIEFLVQARGHSLTVDLPKEKGGQDHGMTPPEVFIASLGSCIGVYVVRYCQNAKLDAKELEIGLEWSLSDDKTKIQDIKVAIILPKADIGKRRNAILEAAHHCLIHNTILGHPSVDITLFP